MRDLIRHFSDQLPQKSNYARIARRFVEHCLTNDLPLNEISYHQYIAGKKPHQISPLKRFWFFYQSIGSPTIILNPTRRGLSPAINELVQIFLKGGTGLEENSKQTYGQALKAFFTYMEEQKQAGQLAALTPSFVEEYVNDMVSRDLSPFTINLHLSAIKQLSAWCIGKRDRLGLLGSQLENLRDIAGVKGRTIDKSYHKDSLDEGQRDELLSSVDSLRDLAILYLLAYEGLRTVEVTRLRLGNLDFQQKLLHVQGKGQHGTKPIKFFKACLPVLQAYLTQKEWWPIPDGEKRTYLFDNGKKGIAQGPLQTYQIRYIVDKALRRNGLKKQGMSAHSLRHTVGQLLIEAGIELEYVQQHLRHASMETTQIYTRKKTETLYFKKMPD